MSDLDSFSNYVIDKARRVKAGNIQKSESDPSLWKVTSSRTGKVHWVRFDGNFVTCTCENGNHRGGGARCYHAAAAIRERDTDEREQDIYEEIGEGDE